MIMVPSDKVIRLAIKEALKSNQREVKMSALIISEHDGRAYSTLRAYNQNIFDSRRLNGKFSIHAEENLIVRAAKRGIKLLGTTVLVYRYKRCNNIPGTSKPCNKCFELLKKAGVTKVVYFDGKGWIVSRMRCI